jgi:hypothetical protein
VASKRLACCTALQATPRWVGVREGEGASQAWSDAPGDCQYVRVCICLNCVVDAGPPAGSRPVYCRYR